MIRLQASEWITVRHTEQRWALRVHRAPPPLRQRLLNHTKQSRSEATAKPEENNEAALPITRRPGVTRERTACATRREHEARRTEDS